MNCDRDPMWGVQSFDDAQLADEYEFALAEKAAGGCLGQRTRVATRIKVLRAEMDLRAAEAMWAVTQ